ncbi:DUF805 domain-containing protein [Flavobacterium zepuense]|uniref:DUF805 domain-containing protein n=1 Tax=Flavobacterium zepuense TaxID=2593302 RepID=A0A552UXE3_9FLAO|nr:DUF805 domain-containing protein [Flavobacterium zepuense]
MEWYLKVVRDNYANFEGRARRSEYWYFTLCNFIVIAILAALVYVSSIFTFVYGLYALAVLVPSIGVAVRRLHDVNKSGWFYLLAFVPLVNIYILVLFLTEGTTGPNEFGPDPKNPIGTEFNDIGRPDTF